MAELADALHSGCSLRKGVQVQVLFRAQYTIIRLYKSSTYNIIKCMLTKSLNAIIAGLCTNCKYSRPSSELEC